MKFGMAHNTLQKRGFGGDIRRVSKASDCTVDWSYGCLIVNKTCKSKDVMAAIGKILKRLGSCTEKGGSLCNKRFKKLLSYHW